MEKGTIVLEGGGTRGVFTAGVLDYLMERDCYLSHVIGVSAGSCNGIDYVAKQPGRTRECTIQKDKEHAYVNLRTMIKDKSMFDMDMIFDRYPNELYPFDYETYFASDMTCEVVTTNCMTGKAEYMRETKDKERLMKICRASSSMPLAAPVVCVDNIPYLDGGLADSIPIRRAVELGNRKIVVVLTRQYGYRKKKPGKGMSALYRSAYQKYPDLIHTILNRARQYNKTLETVERLERNHKIMVIRPHVKTVGRLEQKSEALTDFYEHGYEQMKQHYQELMDYLQVSS